MAYGNDAGLFAYDDDHGIRFFRKAESSPVPQPKVAVEIHTLAQWENTSGGNDPIVP
jgi:hypothetical protein